MTNIKLYCQGTSAWAEVEGAITAGTVGIPVEIQRDSAWEGLVCTLVCMGGDSKIPLVLSEQTPVVAWESLIPGAHLYLGLEGRSREGDLVLLSTWADCGKVQPSPEHSHSQEYTPSEMEQLLVLAGAAKQDSQRALEICQALEASTVSPGTIRQAVETWLQEHPGAAIGYDDRALLEALRQMEEETIPSLSQAVEGALENISAFEEGILGSLDGKVDVQQGAENAGKVMTVLSDGTLAPRAGAEEISLPENLVVAELEEVADEDGATVEALLLDRLSLESDGGYYYLKFGDQTLSMVEVGSPTVYCTGVTITGGDRSVDVDSGETYLSALVTPANCTQTLRWRSADTDVATVDSQGKLTPVGAGTTQITAFCGGYEDSITLEVTDLRVTGWSIRPGYAINTGATQWQTYAQDTRGYAYYGNIQTPIPLTGGKTYRISWDDIGQSDLDADGVCLKIMTFSGTTRLTCSTNWISDRNVVIPAETEADGLTFNVQILSGTAEKVVSDYTSWLEAHIHIKEVA